MNLRCKVCGEKAAGFHFGAFTCEGCKSFFGRCCNNMSIIGECRNNKECVIDKKNRTSCKACRLQKCLTVGMSKNGSRYGRRSNWFKQFFQETEQPDRKTKPEEVEGRADTPPPSRFYQDESNHKITSTDLHTPTSISSHLYLNYLPQLNRFISYGRETKFWLPSSVPLAVLNNDINMNEYFESLMVRRYVKGASEREKSEEREDARESERQDPLDLSQKRNKVQDVGELDKKKSLPLDLSVK